MHPNLRWAPQPDNPVTYIGATENCDVYRTFMGTLVVRWGSAGQNRATDMSEGSRENMLTSVKRQFGKAEVEHIKLLIELFDGQKAASTGP